MSYILDAIQKAEHERQQARTPDLYSLRNQHVTTGKSVKDKWLWVSLLAVGIVTINLSIWLFLPLRQSEQAPLEKTHHEQLDSNPKKLDLEQKPQVAKVSKPATKTKLWQASNEAQTAIGALNFSFHVYSSTVQRRTIIINGQRMREGEWVSSHLKLESITKTGVLLHFNNEIVAVDVLEQW